MAESGKTPPLGGRTLDSLAVKPKKKRVAPAPEKLAETASQPPTPPADPNVLIGGKGLPGPAGPAGEPAQAPPAPAPEKIITREDVVKRLADEEQKRTALMLQRERVQNRAIPDDPGYIHDWFPEYHYFWVPCPPKHRPFRPEEEAQLAKYDRAHYNFYPAAEMRHGPNTPGLPWHPTWTEDGGKVRFMDMWLMYRSREYELLSRKALDRAYNARRSAPLQQVRDDRGNAHWGGRGSVALPDVLKETQGAGRGTRFGAQEESGIGDMPGVDLTHAYSDPDSYENQPPTRLIE